MIENIPNETSAFVISVITNLGFAVKFFFDWRTQKNKETSVASITAYDQLSSLFKTLQEQLGKLELREAEKDKEIETLEQCLNDIQRKAKQARLDLLELNQSVKGIKRFLKDHKIEDEEILETLESVENQLKTIDKCLE